MPRHMVSDLDVTCNSDHFRKEKLSEKEVLCADRKDHERIEGWQFYIMFLVGAVQ
jgi:hypothetical protein